METELKFENTLMVLQDFQKAVRDAYKQNLQSAGHYASGSLWRSVKDVPIIVDGGTIRVELQMNWYWKIIEEGLKPNGKYKNPGNFSGLFKGLLSWVKVKKGLPLGNVYKIPKNKKVPNLRERQEKAFAAAAAHNKLKYGTRASHCLADTVEQTKANFENLIREAISMDIQEGLNVAMGYFTGNSN